MAKIKIGNQDYSCREDETVLEALLRQGVSVKSSCKKGTCGTCKTRLLAGEIPPGSQDNLADEWIANKFIMLCVSRPQTDIQLDVSALKSLKKGEFKKQSPYELREEFESEIPGPDLELWQALGEGTLLIDILAHFYMRVYRDKRLAPFFKSVTIDRAIGKQYNFLEELMTGEKVFFGAYPRTAHHWMVIDEELFEYRENLLEQSMRAFNLPEEMIRRWRAMHDAFKAMMIKDHPWPKIIGGVVVPQIGFDTMVAEFDMLCDSCQEEILTGETVGYHQEDARIFCRKCAGLEE